MFYIRMPARDGHPQRWDKISLDAGPPIGEATLRLKRQDKKWLRHVRPTFNGAKPLGLNDFIVWDEVLWMAASVGGTVGGYGGSFTTANSRWAEHDFNYSASSPIPGDLQHDFYQVIPYAISSFTLEEQAHMLSLDVRRYWTVDGGGNVQGFAIDQGKQMLIYDLDKAAYDSAYRIGSDEKVLSGLPWDAPLNVSYTYERVIVGVTPVYAEDSSSSTIPYGTSLMFNLTAGPAYGTRDPASGVFIPAGVTEGDFVVGSWNCNSLRDWKLNFSTTPPVNVDVPPAPVLAITFAPEAGSPDPPSPESCWVEVSVEISVSYTLTVTWEAAT